MQLAGEGGGFQVEDTRPEGAAGTLTILTLTFKLYRVPDLGFMERASYGLGTHERMQQEHNFST